MRSPESAAPRTDLGWLRHRRARELPPVEYVRKPPVHTSTLSPSPSLDAPAPAPAPPGPTAVVPSSLDLTAPPAPPPPPPPPAPSAGRSLLDLSAPTAPPPGPKSTARTTGKRRRPRTLPYPRVARGTTVPLTAEHPTVTLTRLQSGIGHLRISLVHGASTGDLSLGVVVQKDDGSTHVVQRLGEAWGTPEHPLPLVRMEGNDDFAVDLHLIRSLRRFLVYAYSPSGAAVNWDALLTLRTQDGSRIDAAVAMRVRRGSAALLTAYNVHGELVLRSEMLAFDGPQQLAAEAFGYTYAWLDGRWPIR